MRTGSSGWHKCMHTLYNELVKELDDATQCWSFHLGIITPILGYCVLLGAGEFTRHSSTHYLSCGYLGREPNVPRPPAPHYNPPIVPSILGTPFLEQMKYMNGPNQAIKSRLFPK